MRIVLMLMLAATALLALTTLILARLALAALVRVMEMAGGTITPLSCTTPATALCKAANLGVALTALAEPATAAIAAARSALAIFGQIGKAPAGLIRLTAAVIAAGLLIVTLPTLTIAALLLGLTGAVAVTAATMVGRARAIVFRPPRTEEIGVAVVPVLIVISHLLLPFL